MRIERLGSVTSGEPSADFLDGTLVGVLKESSPSVCQSRRLQFAAFSQSQERSSLDDSDIGPTCAQSEV